MFSRRIEVEEGPLEDQVRESQNQEEITVLSKTEEDGKTQKR